MPRRGNQMGQTVPSTVYPCAGGGPNDYVFTNASQQPMWLAMLEAMGRSDLAKDPRFATEAMRWENRAALNPIIEEWFRIRRPPAVSPCKPAPSWWVSSHSHRRRSDEMRQL